MSTAETIYEIVKTLPEEQANLILSFVESVRQRSLYQNQEAQSISDYLGILKGSPNFNEDPVEIQRAMRSEWE